MMNKILVSILIVLMLITPTLAEVPPVPVNLASTQGNYWVNYTWYPGTGNITDSYNVSITNNSVQSWRNITTPYLNSTLAEDQWSNITVYAYNNSGLGNLSLTATSKNVQAIDQRMLAPTSYWTGFKLYGKWIDLMGFRGMRNGSIQDVTCYSNCTGFTTSMAQLPANITYGGFDVIFNNGTNALVAGNSVFVQAKYTGTLTAISAQASQTGSINVSLYNLTLGTYIGSVNINTGTSNSTSGLVYTFQKGDWLNATVSSVSTIQQVTVGVQTSRT
ncbi:MAG: hypothetical protein PHH85_08980 [Candidatus Methanoperedens sp.]|nr:hypothetical protein [Candidatus Methanoperedens sp.]